MVLINACVQPFPSHCYIRLSSSKQHNYIHGHALCTIWLNIWPWHCYVCCPKSAQLFVFLFYPAALQFPFIHRHVPASQCSCAQRQRQLHEHCMVCHGWNKFELHLRTPHLTQVVQMRFSWRVSGFTLCERLRRWTNLEKFAYGRC